MTQIDRTMAAANEHHRAGRLAEAEDAYRQVLIEQPDHAEALHMLGVVAYRVGQHELATQFIARSIQLNSNNAAAYSNLAAVLRAREHFIDALAACQTALRLQPNDRDTYGILANTLSDLGRLQEAMEIYEQVIRLYPEHATNYTNLGAALFALGRFEEAAAAHERAILLDPDLAKAHWNLAMTLFRQGDPRAWEEYEWRLKIEDYKLPVRNFGRPQWRGEELKGRTILLHCEQGFGDSIQFVRYAPLVAAQGGRVILECPSALLRLFEGLPGVACVIAQGNALPPFDLHCSVMSLPLAFGTRGDSIPTPFPTCGRIRVLSRGGRNECPPARS
jgi:tetratricopeptide (TPR) repeat protein